MVTKGIQEAVGLFPSHEDAQTAVEHLTNAGFNSNQVSIVGKDEEFAKTIATVDIKQAQKNQQNIGGAKAGAITGIATGFFSGGLLGALSVLTIPEVTPVTDVGIIFSHALRGIVIGVTGCSLIGALVGWILTKKQDNSYNSPVNEDYNYVVVVEGSEEDIRKAQSILQNSDTNVKAEMSKTVENKTT